MSETYPDKPTASSHQELATGSVVSSRYRVLRVVGVGACGTVYEVERIGLVKHFALKLLNAQARGDWRSTSRFEAESITASRVDHPNIVSVTDAGRTEQGHPYYVMELLEGETLGQLLLRETSLRSSRAIPILAVTAHALDAAHQAAVIHRDLKPENIFLVPEEDPQTGRRKEGVRILDFGLAKVLESPGLTGDGTTCGTPAYMAPEQLRGEAVDARTDIYALGCIAYEMFAGHKLFDGGIIEIAEAHCFKEVPLLLEAPTPRMRWLVERCLQKRPEARFQSCAEVLTELRAIALDLLHPDGSTRQISLPTADPDLDPDDLDEGSLSSVEWWDEFSFIAERQEGAEVTPSSPDPQVIASRGTPPRPAADDTGELPPAMVAPAHVAPPPSDAAQERPLRGDPRRWLVALLGAAAVTALALFGTLLYRRATLPTTGSVLIEIDPAQARIAVDGVDRPGSGGQRLVDQLSGDRLVVIEASHGRCEPATRKVSVRRGRVTRVAIKLNCNR